MEIFYTKGDPETVFSRIDQIHTITIFCPLGDPGVLFLEESFKTNLESYYEEEHLWKSVPAIDVLNILYKTSKQMKKFENVDKDILLIILGSLSSFPRLKYINFKFENDSSLEDAYRRLLNKKGTIEDKCRIYNIENLEINLTDLFSQHIIDILNKVLMINEIIPNSFLERVFMINFTFSEYISFMDMLAGNNEILFNQLDKNICQYLLNFPEMVVKQKPNIRIITNYEDNF